MEKFSWSAPEYEFKTRSKDWYWTVGIITAALVVTSIIFGNYLFAIILAVGAFTLALFSTREPQIINVSISDKGIRVDKLLYPYPSLKSFGIDEEHHSGPKLFLKPKKLAPLVALPIHSVDIDDLRKYLDSKLDEEIFEDHFMHTIFEKLGF
jgi:hypothetical protein